VYTVPDSLKANEAIFRAGLQALSESQLVVIALTIGNANLGVSDDQNSKLVPLMANTYLKIDADPLFVKAPSALPYCFATTRNTMGHYFLYRPKTLPKDPKTIVFLHGYGGNFRFYTWVLKEEFPDAFILVPSWSASWHDGSPAYLKAMLADAERRTGVSLRTPWLMAISAGGPRGFTIYNQDPGAFAGYVCLASAPETTAARSLRNDLRILMVNGTLDQSFPIAYVRQQAALVRSRVPSLVTKEIPSDHFFLLAEQEQTFKTVKEFMNVRETHSSSPRSPRDEESNRSEK
jgi:predicted esterase